MEDKRELVALWIVSVVVLGLATFSFMQAEKDFTFDPERHICTNEGWVVTDEVFRPASMSNYWNAVDVANEYNSQADRDGRPPTCNVNTFGDVNCKGIERGCLDWRYKTYCELHPNDKKKCVCDEYTIVNKTFFTNESECLPTIFTKNDVEGFDKIDATNGCKPSNCTEAEYRDCGDFHCKVINLTTCVHYTLQIKTVKREVKGECISWRPKTYGDVTIDHVESLCQNFTIENKTSDVKIFSVKNCRWLKPGESLNTGEDYLIIENGDVMG